MKKVIAVILVALLLTGCGAPIETPEAPPAVPQETTVEAPKVAAPDFTVYDRDGNEVKLSDFLGKPVVLNFWATWCGPCKAELPDFEEAYRELGDDVQFMMVNLTDGSGDTVDSVDAFIEQEGYTFPVFYDFGVAAPLYGVNAIPTTYFIDKEGCIVSYKVGMLSAEELRQGIDLIR